MPLPAKGRLLLEMLDQSCLMTEQTEMSIKTANWHFVKPRETRP